MSIEKELSEYEQRLIDSIKTKKGLRQDYKGNVQIQLFADRIKKQAQKGGLTTPKHIISFNCFYHRNMGANHQVKKLNGSWRWICLDCKNMLLNQ